MRRLAMSSLAAAVLLPAAAVAQSGSTDTTRTPATSSSTSTSTSASSSASARGDLLIPLAGGANTGLGYSYNRTSRVVERDLASRGIARAIEGDLAALRNAQDVYFAQHATYATSLDKLPGFRLTSGATIDLKDVSDMGWTAEATHPSLPKSSFRAQVNRAEIVTSPTGP
ncbi:MAG: hypothetical protein HOQ09_14655 [Gemmatimonadaceae bacterium]|nr:hypothetical protein [Gemmatimonadaceae bacterium]